MQSLQFSTEILVILFSVAVITIPGLIISGVPPLAALGTNKLQSSMGTGTATINDAKKKKITWHNVKFLMLMAFFVFAHTHTYANH